VRQRGIAFELFLKGRSANQTTTKCIPLYCVDKKQRDGDGETLKFIDRAKDALIHDIKIIVFTTS
jgi:hypothetical protein